MRIRLPLAEHVRLNESLPWDVLDGMGTLLLRKGTILTDPNRLQALIQRGAYVDKFEYERQAQGQQAAPEPAPEPKLQAGDPFEQWDEIRARLGLLLRHQQNETGFPERLTSLSTDLRRLVERNTDAAIFAMSRLDQSHYGVDHSLQTAVACEIYSGLLQWSDGERGSLINAALTMNITILDLQRLLAQQREPLTPEQKAEIHGHPEAAHRLLAGFGVVDEIWLQAVLQHHELTDGSGYPRGLTELTPAAEVLNVADRYCAMLSSRRSRDAMISTNAARDLYTSSAGKLQAIVARMIKAYGLYPPGNFVKLANGEIAVVVRRGESANKPRVSSVVSARGTRLTDPISRDTADAEFAIARAVPATAAAVAIDCAKLYGYRSGVR